MKITVIGEANIDISVRQQDDGNLGGCTPADIRFHHGGVARNVAHNLCLLGHEVRLMTVFGGDDFAKKLAEECTALGMDLSLSSTFETEKSPIFLSFNDDLGDIQSAVSDVKLNERLDLSFVKAKSEKICQSEIVVADTLLTSDALAYLIDNMKVPLFLDAVSPRRAQRIVEAMEWSKKKTLFALKCNLPEAQLMTGLSDPLETAKALNYNGIKEVFLTLGADGAVYSSTELTLRFSALPAKVVNVTGSGDAFLAGIVHAYSLGFQGSAAMPMGLKTAQHNSESDAPVNLALHYNNL
jgi:pseudouridine kinase